MSMNKKQLQNFINNRVDNAYPLIKCYDLLILDAFNDA